MKKQHLSFVAAIAFALTAGFSSVAFAADDAAAAAAAPASCTATAKHMSAAHKECKSKLHCKEHQMVKCMEEKDKKGTYDCSCEDHKKH